MSSTRAKHWAWKQADVSRSELLLLLAMADHVGEKLLCYAAFGTLAAMARMSERTAQRCADRLVDAGKLERIHRPGQTTLFRFLIPAEFGLESEPRTRRRTPDKMSGVGGGGSAGDGGRTPDMLSGVTPDKMSGVYPRQNDGTPTTECRDTPDKMSSDSSLNSSLNIPKARARDGSKPVSLTRQDQRAIERELRTLDHEAKRLKAPPRTETEPLEHFRKRIAELVNREIAERAERILRDRESDQPPDEVAA